MLYTDRIKNLTSAYPKLSRVWIKTEDTRTPLKSIWISESALRDAVNESSAAPCESESAELTEDHLLCAA
jgi:hypothetical protein